jgi:hypothetical protein
MDHADAYRLAGVAKRASLNTATLNTATINSAVPSSWATGRTRE